MISNIETEKNDRHVWTYFVIVEFKSVVFLLIERDTLEEKVGRF